MIKNLDQAQLCLGFCLDEVGNLHRFYSATESFSSSEQALSLKDLLMAISPNPAEHSSLYKADRMMIAVILSLSYFQLQATPWLQQTWTKETILFDKDHTVPSIKPLNVDRPYLEIDCPSGPVAHTLTQQSGPLPLNSASPSLMSSSPGNSSLLALGILLLELYTGQVFENCGFRKEATDPSHQHLYDYYALVQWRDATRDRELSNTFEKAVTYCITNYMNPPRTEGEAEAFRRALYDEVVLPIDDELQVFTGKRSP